MRTKSPSGSLGSWSAASTVHTDSSLHQIAPYIGRMKTAIARFLIENCTSPGDLVVDPFCGSGVVPLEAAIANRRVVAGDWNPYGVLLTRAKLFFPATLPSAVEHFERIWRLSRSLLKEQDLRAVPHWVRSFFHPETLRSALAFRDACIQAPSNFLLACLLGILHHQRPGFLSYPSSHLVPYLRDRKFPRADFPHLYRCRDVRQRMLAKLVRTYRRIPSTIVSQRKVLHRDARRFPLLREVQTVITSPPYMNELDYVRDNRLRLWFINRSIPTDIELPRRDIASHFLRIFEPFCVRFGAMIRAGGSFALILGDAARPGKRTDVADLAMRVFKEHPSLRAFSLDFLHREAIPDIRRCRRQCRGTKTETVLVYRRRI